MAEPIASKSLHVLIIEDEILVGMGMQSMLADIGFDSFAFASTANQALQQARMRRPDLVTADIGLLDGDGLAAWKNVAGHLGLQGRGRDLKGVQRQHRAGQPRDERVRVGVGGHEDLVGRQAAG